jgi:hypothetical protein
MDLSYWLNAAPCITTSRALNEQEFRAYLKLYGYSEESIDEKVRLLGFKEPGEEKKRK